MEACTWKDEEDTHARTQTHPSVQNCTKKKSYLNKRRRKKKNNDARAAAAKAAADW